MPKLTENQMNFVYLGVAIVIFIIFCVLAWFDSGEKEIVIGETQKVQKEIDAATAKKNAIKNLKKDLYTMHKSYELFKKYLPDQKKILEFFETLDDFRKKEKIENLLYFKTKGKDTIELGKDSKSSKNKKKKRRKKKKSVFIEDVYSTSFRGTYEQIGKLLDSIESFDRFFSLNKLSLKSPSFGENITFKVDLVINSYTYSGKTPLETQVNKYVKKIKVTAPIKEAVEGIEKKFKQVDEFKWKKPDRNPFNKYAVLDPIATPGRKEQKKKIEFKLPDKNQLEETIARLKKNRIQFRAIANVDRWLDLQNEIKQKEYEKDLRIVIPNKYDKNGKLKKEIQEMKKELREWKHKIEKANREKKALELINLAKKKLKEMKTLYEKGKKVADTGILSKVKGIYNSLYPMFKGMEDLEESIPPLKELKIRVEDYNIKADTQIRIINMTKKLTLQGIIFIKNNPKDSVAFVNQKVVHKNDPLGNGFIVDEIKPKLIILRYKEETVPLHLKKYKSKSKDKQNTKRS